MKKTDKNPIKTVFDRVMKSAGFSKKSGTWYLDCEEVVLLANLQKSQFGQQYYINLGVWLKEIEPTPAMQDSLWPISMRAEFLPGMNESLLKMLLDLDKIPPESAEQEQKLEQQLREKLVPFLMSLNTTKMIRQAILNAQFARGLVHAKVRKLLSLA